MYVVTRYSESESIFLDPVTFSAAIAQAPLVPLSAEARRVLTEGNFRPLPVMSSLAPPEHARIRGHNARTFSAASLCSKFVRRFV